MKSQFNSEIKTVFSVKRIYLSNVIFGDVWFCSGQSNMAMQMERIANGTEEIEYLTNFTIRFTDTKNRASMTTNEFQDVPIDIPWTDSSNTELLK